MAQLAAQAKTEIYGDVVQISQTEYTEVVNTKKTWVIVHLYKDGLVSDLSLCVTNQHTYQ